MSSSSRSSSRRSASTRPAGTSSPAGHDQPIEIDVDLAAEQTQKNPVYYVQYAHARIAGIMRNAGDAELSARHPRRAGARGARSSSSGSSSFPAVVAEAAERRAAARAADVRDPRRRRLPPLLPPPPRARERATRRRSGSACAGRRRPSSRAASTSSGLRRRSGCRIRHGAGVGGRANRHRPDRNLALELVRVTEAAAMGAGRWIGRGDKERRRPGRRRRDAAMLDTVAMDGVVVIGEGEKDEAPMLYNGEEVGDGNGPAVDVAVDPLEGTRLTALGPAERDRGDRGRRARDDVLPRRRRLHGQDRRRAGGGRRDRHRRAAGRERRRASPRRRA